MFPGDQSMFQLVTIAHNCELPSAAEKTYQNIPPTPPPPTPPPTTITKTTTTITKTTTTITKTTTKTTATCSPHAT